MEIGYTLMCEQAGPKQLVRDAVAAEAAGFDFAVISDHYFPWLAEQGHSPNAWSVLGAIAQATDHIPLMTFVTCPIRRYHPAVVAQLAATTALLSTAASPSAWAPGRTSTSTWSAVGGPRSTSGTRCSPRPSRSSAPCSPAPM